MKILPMRIVNAVCIKGASNRWFSDIIELFLHYIDELFKDSCAFTIGNEDLLLVTSAVIIVFANVIAEIVTF